MKKEIIKKDLKIIVIATQKLEDLGIINEALFRALEEEKDKRIEWLKNLN